MKILASMALVLAGVVAAKSDLDMEISSMIDPVFGDDLLVIVSLQGEDATSTWTVDDEEIEDAVTDTGEVLDEKTIILDLALPGDMHPVKRFGETVPEGEALIVFKFRKPKQPAKSVEKFVASFRALRGGKRAWIDVPFEDLQEPARWENEDLAEAGFELDLSVRDQPVARIQFKGVLDGLDGIEARLPGSEEDLMGGTVDGGFGFQNWEFRLPDDAGDEVDLVLEMEDGAELVIEGVKLGSRPKQIRDSRLKEAKLEVEASMGERRIVSADGKGDFDRYSKYRWVDRRGKAVEIFPNSSASGGGNIFSTELVVPHDLPRGVSPQLGVFVGAEWDDVEFDISGIPIGKAKKR